MSGVKRQLLAVMILSVTISAEMFSQFSDMLFRHFITDDGLSHNTVYAVDQDTLGFIWIGTRSGLNRFDGKEFKIYDLNQGLKDIYINTIFRDSHGILWIGTQQGGLSRYDYGKDRFESWLISGNGERFERTENILAIAEDRLGRLWVGTHGGEIRLFNREEGSFSEVKLLREDESVPDPERITAIMFDTDTTAWLGTFRGLYRMRHSHGPGENEFIITRIFEPWVSDIHFGTDGRLWTGTNSGVIAINLDGSVFRTYSTFNSSLQNNNITDVDQLPDGRIIISSDGGGLSIIDPDSDRIQNTISDPNDLQSLSNNSVYDIFIDREGALWAGNYMGGINYYSMKDWKFAAIRHLPQDPESLPDNHVRSFHEDSDGNLWIGGPGMVTLYDREKRSFASYLIPTLSGSSLSSNLVLSIYETDNEHLLIGTFDAGVFTFNKKTLSFSRFRHQDDRNNSLERSSIYQITDDGSGKIIFATLGGIYVLDTSSDRMVRFTSSNSPLSNNTVKSAFRDRHGNVWLGTNYGLNRYNPSDNSFKLFLHSSEDPASLSNNRILSVTEASDGKLWVGTEGGGVSILDPESERFESVSTDEGLPHNVINAVAEDNQGYFWLSTNKGLSRYDRGTGKISSYTMSDGLQGNEFYQNACLRSSDGSLFFGGPYGFNHFDPAAMKVDSVPPKVTFTDLYISGRLIREYDDRSIIDRQLCMVDVLRFPYHSSFVIHFAVPGIPNRNQFLFSVYLRGADEGWSEFQKINSANFSNLHPGRYTLYVKALNNDGIVSKNPASIDIRVLPPWWKTWWVFIIYAIMVGSLLAILLRLNNSKLRAWHALQIQIKEKEHAEELSQMKISFFTDISHEFKTPLTLILGHLDKLKENTVSGTKSSIYLIETNARRLLLLINQLLEFRKAESGLMKLNATKGNIVTFLSGIKDNFSGLAESRNIRLEMVTDGTMPEIWFDNEKMEKIIFNLLSNAIKFTEQGGLVQLRIRTGRMPVNGPDRNNSESVIITVSDNGRGISTEELPHIFERFYHGESSRSGSGRAEGSGIGLALSKLLVDLHHGAIVVSSEEGKGSEFTVFLPVGKNHLSDHEIKEDEEYHLKLDYNLAPDSGKEQEVPEAVSKIEKGKSIMLIVDDNPSICQVLTEKFQGSFSVLTAADGESGLQKAKYYLPDVIISDIMMPLIDGFEFCHLLKTNMNTSHIPVILLSAKSEEDDRIHGYSEGADAYIAKPYNPDLLKATVDNLLASRRLLRKKYLDQAGGPSPVVMENKLDEQFLKKLVSLIESERFGDGSDISSLCSELGMSRSVIYRKVKILTDNSIQDFVRIVRLRKAARLLKETLKPVSEIAFVSGFQNTKHFSTAFKKLYGCTPSSFRMRE